MDENIVVINNKQVYHPWSSEINGVKFRTALPKGWKRFECDKCGYKFIKDMPSGVCRCTKCEHALIGKGLRENSLPDYSKLKLIWLRNPKAWEESILKQRQLVGASFDQDQEKMVGGRVIYRDSFGNNLGGMPELVEI